MKINPYLTLKFKYLAKNFILQKFRCWHEIVVFISNHFFYFPAHQRLEPATLSAIVAFILSLLCGALNLIRGFHAIESLLQVLCWFCNFRWLCLLLLLVTQLIWIDLGISTIYVACSNSVFFMPALVSPSSKNNDF